MASPAYRADSGTAEAERRRMSRLRVINSILLATCVAMYFGTGWSLILFSFPIRPQLIVNNYYLHFVPQVTAPTHFFTWMTAVMLVSYSRTTVIR